MNLPELREAPRNTHDLKTWVEPFDAVWSGDKPYEIRKNDRGYQVGDQIILREWNKDAERYTGRSVYARVTYMTKGGDWGLPADLCVLGIRVISKFDGREAPHV